MSELSRTRSMESLGASRVKILSKEEIDLLVSKGEITPVEQIPVNHSMFRVSRPKGSLEFIR